MQDIATKQNLKYKSHIAFKKKKKRKEKSRAKEKIKIPEFISLVGISLPKHDLVKISGECIVF